MAVEIKTDVTLLPCQWHPKSAVNPKNRGQFRHWIECYGGCRGPHASSEKEAIAAWNTRATPAVAPDGLVERVTIPKCLAD